MALDVLPCPASSVPCECLFSASKQVVTERRSCLGSDQVKQLLVMNSAWNGTLVDWATKNSDMVEEVGINEFCDFLQANIDAEVWEKENEIFTFASDWLAESE